MKLMASDKPKKKFVIFWFELNCKAANNKLS